MASGFKFKRLAKLGSLSSFLRCNLKQVHVYTCIHSRSASFVLQMNSPRYTRNKHVRTSQMIMSAAVLNRVRGLNLLPFMKRKQASSKLSLQCKHTKSKNQREAACVWRCTCKGAKTGVAGWRNNFSLVPKNRLSIDPLVTRSVRFQASFSEEILFRELINTLSIRADPRSSLWERGGQQLIDGDDGALVHRGFRRSIHLVHEHL